MVKEKAKNQENSRSKQLGQGEFLFKTMDDALKETDLNSSKGMFHQDQK